MNAKKDLLTPRELEVLTLQQNGFDAQEIADKLGCSRYTVNTHIRHIHSKLYVHTTTKAIYMAIKLGLIKR
jgi:DNA-binding NarL/FixJ family response regulator